MQFCPKCGSILIQKKKNYGCRRCNYTTKEKPNLKIKESLGKKQKIAVIKEGEVDVLPIVEETCPNCKKTEAYFWTSQTRSGDEAETKFYRCKKCSHTWREYR